MITLLGATSFSVISFVQNSESIFNFSNMRVNNSPLPVWDLLGSLHAVNIWQSKLTVDLSNGDQLKYSYCWLCGFITVNAPLWQAPGRHVHCLS